MKQVTELFIPKGSTIQHAIEVINRGAAQIALVVDSEQRLLGTITDGDIRRAFLRGESFDSSIDRIMNTKFRSVPVDTGEREALAAMRRDMLHQIPMLDKEGRVQRLFLLEDLIRGDTLSNTVILMAGGEGRRLRPLTHEHPKPMLRIGGKPILEIILEQCVEAGLRDVYISVNYLKEQIKDHFGRGRQWGVNIEYLEEDVPLGTAGPLGLLPERPSQPVLVMNGDILTRVDFSRMLRFHAEHKATATVAVREHWTEIPYGVVVSDDTRVRNIEERPLLRHNVMAGIYVLNPNAMDLVPNGDSFDMPDLVEKIIQADETVAAFPIHEYWLDVGHPETMDQAEQDWC